MNRIDWPAHPALQAKASPLPAAAPARLTHPVHSQGRPFCDLAASCRSMPLVLTKSRTGYRLSFTQHPETSDATDEAMDGYPVPACSPFCAHHYAPSRALFRDKRPPSSGTRAPPCGEAVIHPLARHPCASIADVPVRAKIAPVGLPCLTQPGVRSPRLSPRGLPCVDTRASPSSHG